ncbi:hypothetical protein BC827DRAFT_635762 [Russula dissimulans]|nr:hypothetical protein BC827DRAFT_635762 [Russula dissimulans]
MTLSCSLASVFQLGHAIPSEPMASQHTYSRSTIMSVSGNGTLSSATTFRWCGVSENDATRTSTGSLHPHQETCHFNLYELVQVCTS